MDEEFDKNKKAALVYLNQKSEHNISTAEPQRNRDLIKEVALNQE